MPLRLFECPVCKSTTRRLSSGIPICATCEGDTHLPSEMVEILVPPAPKMMESLNPYTGKSRMKDQTKILRERSRAHARDREAEDLISLNRKNGIEKTGFLNKDGTKRRKIDDI